MKKIELELDCCDECPYLRFDPDYGRSYDCGWDCGHSQGGFRIADEGSIQDREKNKWYGTVSCRIGKPFPDKCPLSDVN